MNVFERAAQWSRGVALETAEAAISRGITEIDARQWCPTPRGGYMDGRVIQGTSVESLAESMLSWWKNSVAIDRCRRELGLPVYPGMPRDWHPGMPFWWEGAQ